MSFLLLKISKCFNTHKARSPYIQWQNKTDLWYSVIHDSLAMFIKEAYTCTRISNENEWLWLDLCKWIPIMTITREWKYLNSCRSSFHQIRTRFNISHILLFLRIPTPSLCCNNGNKTLITHLYFVYFSIGQPNPQINN